MAASEAYKAASGAVVRTQAELPSGGVRVPPPDLKGIAPLSVQRRVAAERLLNAIGPRDAQGRPRLSMPKVDGSGGRRPYITLPKCEFVDRMLIKEQAEAVARPTARSGASQ